MPPPWVNWARTQCTARAERTHRLTWPAMEATLQPHILSATVPFVLSDHMSALRPCSFACSASFVFADFSAADMVNRLEKSFTARSLWPASETLV